MSIKHDSNIDRAYILIVDDESANLKLLSEILVREGYRVRPANSPRLAIDSALSKSPDLILLDIRMPDMDGFEVCASLKQDERTSDIPILFISALQDTKAIVRAFNAGGVDFITKPFQEEEVLARVRTHLNLRNMQRNLEELVAERTAELAKSEQLARTLLNATTDLTHLIDEDGIILDLNDSSAEKIGGTREELVGTNIFAKFSPELAEARHNMARKALATGESIRFVDRFRPGDVFDTGVYPVETPPGEKGRVVIFAHDISERIKAESDLRESEEKFRRLVENVPDVIWTTDAAGKTIYISSNVREIFGFSQKEVYELSELWLDRIHPDDIDRVKMEFSRLFKTGEPFDTEYRIRHKDGHWIWLHDRSMSIYQANGITYADGLFSDFTYRKQAEQDLQKSRDYLEHLINSIPDAVFSVKLPERIIQWARDPYKVLGGNVEEHIGETTERLYNSVDEFKTMGELTQKAIRENKDSFIAESLLRNRNGAEPIPVEINTTIYRDKGVPVSATALVRDISFRKKAQEALENSEARLKEAQRIARMGNWELDLLTDALTWSEEVFRIFELDPNDFDESYEAFLNAVHPDDRDTVNDAYKRSLTTRQPYGLDHRLLMPDGRIKYVREQCETVYSPEGKPLRSVGTVQDITTTKQADEERMGLRLELAHLNRVMQMNELSASLAHELNQPLGAILNNASAAQILNSRNKERDDGIDEILGDIIQDADRIGQIVQRIRAAIKKEEPTFKLLNMNGLIKDVVESFKKNFRKNHVSVVLDLQPKLKQIRGDHIGLQQVLINLITNALEAMRESSSKMLEIGTTMPSPDKLIVRVGDSGMGIDETIKDNLFAPFFTTKKDGLGMGLGICWAIIEEHGGRIWVENNPVAGATFYVSLNAYRGESA